MLKTIDIINEIVKRELEDNKILIEMVKQVNIPDFCKCIAQFSGIPIGELRNDIITEYLITWAINKKTFFKMLKNKIKKDFPFSFVANQLGASLDKYESLANVFPAYFHWLSVFKQCEKNEIDFSKIRTQDYEDYKIIKKLFPSLIIDNNKTSITHFFKKYLNAPDDLVTEIGNIYSLNEITNTFTISIDPVDMMLASETPYSWRSCYALDRGHADGCLAAVLDTSSLLAYAWDKEGKYNLYDNYKFTKIRYKILRFWIALSQDLLTIHFNKIYPIAEKEELEEALHRIVKDYISDYLHIENIWTEASDTVVNRVYGYGYSEYDEDYLEENILATEKEDFGRELRVFDTLIISPDGDGYLPGLYHKGPDYNDYDFCNGYKWDYRYNEEGYVSSNMVKTIYCPYSPEDSEEFCCFGCETVEDCEEMGFDCSVYAYENPVCFMDTGVFCEKSDEIDSPTIEDGIAQYSEICKKCNIYKQKRYKNYKLKKETKEGVRYHGNGNKFLRG